MHRVERAVVADKGLVLRFVKVTMDGGLNIGFQFGVDGSADVEATGDERLHTLLWVAAAESGFQLRDDPVDEMRGFDGVLVAGEGHLRGERLGLFDDRRRDRTQTLDR